jgi:hypothetical protein
MAGCGPRHSFACPNCTALYELIKVEAGPETVHREVACRSCEAPLPGIEGKFVLKYFLLRKGQSPSRLFAAPIGSVKHGAA